MSRRAWLGWVAGSAALVAAASHGCSTLADDCLEGRCWEPEGTGGSGASTSSGGGQGGDGQGGGGMGGGGQGGDSAGCGNNIVEPGEVCFTAPFVTYPTGGIGAVDMVVTDCDQDGDDDLIVANGPSENVTVLRNDADGLAPLAPQAIDLSGGVGLRLALAETDGTAGAELFVAGSNPFESVDLIDLHDLSNCTLFPVRSFTGVAVNYDLGAIRFSGDNFDEPVAVALDFTELVGKLVYTTDGSAAGTCTVVEAETDAPAGMAVAQLGGSALLDIAYVDPTLHQLLVRMNAGSAFGAAAIIPVAGGPIAVSAGDIDGDDDNDLAVAGFDGNMVRLFENNGGSFGQVGPDLIISAGASVPANEPVDVQLVDIDADGDLDILTANSDDTSGASSVSLFLGDGSGSFAAATTVAFPDTVAASFPIEVGRQPAAVRAIDVNNDGALDIVTTSGLDEGGTSHVSVLLAVP